MSFMHSVVTALHKLGGVKGFKTFCLWRAALKVCETEQVGWRWEGMTGVCLSSGNWQLKPALLYARSLRWPSCCTPKEGALALARAIFAAKLQLNISQGLTHLKELASDRSCGLDNQRVILVKAWVKLSVLLYYSSDSEKKQVRMILNVSMQKKKNHYAV